MKISVVIPNWNGLELLKKNLPSVIAAKPDEIIITDNASEDGSVEFITDLKKTLPFQGEDELSSDISSSFRGNRGLKSAEDVIEQKYPDIFLIKNSTNLGFALGCNQGVKKAKNELIVLLNNDVIPERDAISNAMELFNDPKLFAVSFHEPQWSWARIFWKNGYVEHEAGIGKLHTHISAWASGGSGIFRKSIWEELNGFDDLYAPFYWEDIDLSYRAWKRGYQVLWEPRAIVHHKHEGTVGKHFSKDYVGYISERNRLMFIWKNITDSQMLKEHFLGLLKRCKNPGYLKVIIAALTKLPVIRKKRAEESKRRKVSDREIIGQFTQ